MSAAVVNSSDRLCLWRSPMRPAPETKPAAPLPKHRKLLLALQINRNGAGLDGTDGPRDRQWPVQSYQIDYLEFPSTDGLRTRRFFAEAFGWSFLDFGPTYHGIEAAGIDAGIQANRDRKSTRL